MVNKPRKKDNLKRLKGFAYLKEYHPEKLKKFYEERAKKVDYKQHGKKLAEWNKKNPESLSKAGKKAGKILAQWLRNHPEHQSMAGKISRTSPEDTRRRGILSVLSQGNKFISKPEKIMRQLLPFDFIHGKQLGNIGVPDFHSPERKIVIQVDGVYWHNKPEVKERDERQTKQYQELGYRVFRITDLDINEYMKPLLSGGIQ